MEDLEIFYPQPRILPLRGGRELSLLPLTMSRTPAFLKAVGPAMALLQAGAVRQAIEDEYPGLREAVAIATGLDPADLDALLPDEFLMLVVAVIEVNLSFFVRRVVPQLGRMIQLVRPPAPNQAPVPPGPPSSQDLSAPATA